MGNQERTALIVDDLVFRAKRNDQWAGNLSPAALIHTSDPDVVREEFRADKEEAILHLCDITEKLVYYVIRNLNISDQDKEDILQDCRLHMLNLLCSYDSNVGASFITLYYYWLMKARSDYFRFLAKYNEKILEDKEEDEEDQLLERIGCNNDLSELDERMLYIDLKNSIEKLDESKRLVIDLYYNKGLTLSQIGAQIGRSHETVRNIRNQALSLLQEMTR